MGTSESKIDVEQFVTNLLDFQYREVLMTGATLAVITVAIVLFPGAENVTQGIQSDVSVGLFVLFIGIAILAGTVMGMLGFGFSLIVTPVFASVIDPTLTVVVLAVPPLMVNVFQMGETGTGIEFVRKEWPLLGLAIVGTLIGVAFLSWFSTGPLVPFLIGLIVLGYVVFQVVKNFVVIEEAHHPVALGGIGLLEGFLLAAANLGPVLPAYFHTFERDAERYIGGLSMTLGTIFATRLVVMTFFTDLMTPYRLWLGSVIAVVTIVGLLLGTYLRRIEIDEQKFTWFVITLLFVISLNIFRNTIPALFF
ncbi:sulfite exporter TauE/SafE family protein [Halalkalicoccus subterraneus]|uniref:sulfite exporter TauE/SafE family protein n=1 Tax=Halalkalicoccus subterraneus TaxID=2675002 RepID=UPI000EFBF802|nr:sulfite exporter TauE/SafE family protein [Halalkalicoccus subterraneus]